MVLKGTTLLWVALGGGLGSVLRALLSYLLRGAVPWNTFVVNVLGGLLIGFLIGAAVGTAGTSLSENARAFWVVGLCGGFTTFSAFSYENFVLLHGGRSGTALLYIFLSVGACLLAVWAGARLARLV